MFLALVDDIIWHDQLTLTMHHYVARQKQSMSYQFYSLLHFFPSWNLHCASNFPFLRLLLSFNGANRTTQGSWCTDSLNFVLHGGEGLKCTLLPHTNPSTLGPVRITIYKCPTRGTPVLIYTDRYSSGWHRPLSSSYVSAYLQWIKGQFESVLKSLSSLILSGFLSGGQSCACVGGEKQLDTHQWQLCLLAFIYLFFSFKSQSWGSGGRSCFWKQESLFNLTWGPRPPPGWSLSCGSAQQALCAFSIPNSSE